MNILVKKMMAYAIKDGIHVATPVFDGAKESDVKDLLTSAQLANFGSDGSV